MSKYTIVGIKPHEIYSGQKIIELLREVGLEVQPELRKYDWGKTLDDVLVKNGNGYLMRHGDCTHPTKWLSDLWQPNIHGKCPVDSHACVLQLRHIDGFESEVAASRLSDANWRGRLAPSAVLAWRFVRLADGYEW